MSRLAIAVVCMVLLAGAAAWAGDIISMPTGNMVQPGNFELNYIFWDLEGVPAEGGGTIGDSAQIGELFVGATKNIELDVLHVDLQDVDNFTELNLYGQVLKETADRPGMVVGLTNVTGSNWLQSEDMASDKRISPFVIFSYNAVQPAAAPNWNDPLVRLHLGYGTNYHENTPFGGAQIAFTPQFGIGIFNYRKAPAYLAVFRPVKAIEIRAGTYGGDPLISGGWYASW